MTDCKDSYQFDKQSTKLQTTDDRKYLEQVLGKRPVRADVDCGIGLNQTIWDFYSLF